MSVEYVVNASERTDVGKGASRRLRRAGMAPAVIYGSHKDPVNLVVAQNEIVHQLANEGFYSRILTVQIGERGERAVLRDLQRHPYKPWILHIDFQRVSEDENIRVNVPLHFLNEDTCVGVKQQGGTISHLMLEVEITCLPRYLPEYIDVDVGELGLGESIHLSEVTLPEGVELAALSGGSEHDATVVNVHHTVVARDDEETDEEEREEGVDEEDVE